MKLAKIIFSTIISFFILFCFVDQYKVWSAEGYEGYISYERSVIGTLSENEKDSLAEDGYIIKYKDEAGDVLKDGEIYDNQNLVTREESTDIYYSGESAEDSTGDLIENFLILLQSSDN